MTSELKVERGVHCALQTTPRVIVAPPVVNERGDVEIKDYVDFPHGDRLPKYFRTTGHCCEVPKGKMGRIV